MFSGMISIKRILIATAIGAAALFTYNAAILAQPMNGFDLSDALIPEDKVFEGGPPKDGIPSIDEPIFVKIGVKPGLNVSEVKRLDDDDLVLGINLNGIARAYPIPIMNWHEIVNDQFGDLPVVITFCPLCGSGMAFESTINGRKLTFGVSGLLYNSDVLLYDRQTESLWSQIKSQAVSGEFKSTRLKSVPMQHTTWKHWREQFPDTEVLSYDTGYRRDYGRDPYSGYENIETTYFPVEFRAKGLHPKEKVIGLEVNGQFKAWPFVELRKANKAGKAIKDIVGGKQVSVKFNDRSNSARILDKEGNELPAVTLFWFAWSAFHPQTALYSYNPG